MAGIQNSYYEHTNIIFLMFQEALDIKKNRKNFKPTLLLLS